MKKKKQIVERPAGYVHKIGTVWYLTSSIDALATDGKIIRTRRKIRLGPVSELPDEAAARAKADQILETQKNAAQPSMTLRAYCAGAFTQEHIAKLKESSQGAFRTILNGHVLPALGDKRLDSVTSSDVETLIRLKLEADYSVQTAKHIKNCISGIYTHANSQDVFGRKVEYRNPAKNVKLPELIPKKHRALTLEQSSALVRALYREDFRVATMVALCLNTSCTRAEVCGLKWGRLNLTPDAATSDSEHLAPYTMRVQQNYYRNRFSTVKTKRRQRLLVLAKPLVEALLSIKNESEWTEEQDVVFCGGKRGVPADIRTIEKNILKPVAKALGMPWASWHGFRHSYGSSADELDFSVTDRLSAMGHADTKMMMRYTSRQLDSRRPGAEEMANRIMGVKAEGQAEGHDRKAG